MRLAVSNIAWDPSEDAAIAAVLRRGGAQGIEIAPTKWRAEPVEAAAGDVSAFRRTWEERGLPIIAMQSLLFGKPELQLFGTDAQRRALSEYLTRMLDFAAAVGAGAVVFGSPRNRRRAELDVGEANAITIEFLRDLAPHAGARGVAFCLEPVPARYNCDFIHTPAEALAIVQAVDAPGICVNADLGAITAAGDDVLTDLEAARGRIGHFHASERDFVPLCDEFAHRAAAAALGKIGYTGWVSIEMQAVGGGENVRAVERALSVARACYRAARDTASGRLDPGSN